MNPTYCPKIQFNSYHEFNKWIQTWTMQDLPPNLHISVSHRRKRRLEKIFRRSSRNGSQEKKAFPWGFSCKTGSRRQFGLFFCLPRHRGVGLCSDPLFWGAALIKSGMWRSVLAAVSSAAHGRGGWVWNHTPGALKETQIDLNGPVFDIKSNFYRQSQHDDWLCCKPEL